MSENRRGMALLTAMVLLALSAALVVGTFTAGRATQHAALLARARTRVDVGVSRAFGEVLAAWSVGLDSLPRGRSTEITLPAEPVDAGPTIVRRARVERVAERLYAVTVELRAFSWEHPVARRRARLWLESRTDAPSGAAPVPVTQWALVDLY